MGDKIRVDLHEMDVLSCNLRRLSGELEDIGSALYRAQLRLDGAAQVEFGDELTRSRKRLMQVGERSKAVARSILRSAEQFADCERAERRRFEENLRMFPAPIRAALCGERRRKRENPPFTPKNVHSVRMPVQEESSHI